MKRTYIKKVLGDLFKAMDQKGFGQCEVMKLEMKTCLSDKGELFVHTEAVIDEPGKDGKSYEIKKDFDL